MPTRKEEFKLDGEEVLKKVRELIAEGNVRRITVKGKEGNVIADFPLTIGVIGALLVPPLAAIGAIAALVSECTVTIEREEA